LQLGSKLAPPLQESELLQDFISGELLLQYDPEGQGLQESELASL